MARSNSVISTATLDTGIIRFDVKDAGTLDFDPTKAAQSNRLHAEIHGWIQRISDAAALSRDTKTGQSATPAEKLEAMRALVEYYETGATDWSRVRTAGEKGGFLFEALCRVFADKTPDEIRAFLDGLSTKEQAALREDDTVAPVITAIKAERSKDAPKLDTKGILAGLTAPAAPAPDQTPAA